MQSCIALVEVKYSAHCTEDDLHLDDLRFYINEWYIVDV